MSHEYLKGKLAMLTRSVTAVVDGYDGESIHAGTVVFVADPTTNWSKVIKDSRVVKVPTEYLTLCKPSRSLEGKTFCFTGQLDKTRDFYKAFVKLHGGDFRKTVTRDLNYLVMAYPNSYSTKAHKARSYGTKCINETELLSMIKV
jgi:NAD-dependent DNA ligase